MYPPSLLNQQDASSQCETRSPAHFIAPDPSGKSWYTKGPQDWLGARRRPWGVSSHMQLSESLEPYAVVPRLSGRGVHSALASSSIPERPPSSDSSASEDPLPHGCLEPEMRAMSSSDLYTHRPAQTPTVKLGISSLTHEAPMDPALSSHCHEVVSLHGGYAVPPHTYAAEETTMPLTVYNTLRPPPDRLESMASITSFTMDSARALTTIHDLAAIRVTLARSRPSASSSASTVVAPSCTLEALSSAAEDVSRLTSITHAEPDIATSIQSSLSPMSELSRSATPTPQELLMASPVSKSLSPSLSPVHHSSREASPAIQPLKYVVTTPAHVLASISSPTARPSTSFFTQRGRGRARSVINSQSFKLYNPEDAPRKVEPPQKKPRRTPRPRPRPPNRKASPAQFEPEVVDNAPSDSSAERLVDDRPPRETVAQLAVGAGPQYNMNRVNCLWPGCLANDYPGELWQHIQATHRRNPGRAKPSGNPILACSWAPPGEPRANRCTFEARASKMWDHFIAVHHKESVREKGEIVCRLGQCVARSKNLDFQRHLEDVHWKLEGTVRWCEGCGLWKRFDKGRLLTHFQNCIRKYMESDPGFRQGLDEI